MVTPDTLPFADKAPGLPTSVTVVCRADTAARASEIGIAAQSLGDQPNIASDGLSVVTLGERLMVNWTPARADGAGDFATSAQIVGAFLRERQCGDLNYQLESGPGATLPPATGS